MRIYRKISSLMIAFGLLLWFVAGTCLPVHAEDYADGSLQLVCKSDDVILSGMELLKCHYFFHLTNFMQRISVILNDIL